MSFIFQGAIKTSNVIFELDEIKFSCFTILNKQEVSGNVEQRADPEMKKKTLSDVSIRARPAFLLLHLELSCQKGLGDDVAHPEAHCTLEIRQRTPFG